MQSRLTRQPQRQSSRSDHAPLCWSTHFARRSWRQAIQLGGEASSENTAGAKVRHTSLTGRGLRHAIWRAKNPWRFRFQPGTDQLVLPGAERYAAEADTLTKRM